MMRGNHAETVAAARSLLFVPGNRADRFDKAAVSGADAVILDLEDAVTAELKHTARAAVAAWLNDGGYGMVRINAWDTPDGGPDCAALAGLPGLVAVIVPKAEDPAVFAAVRRVIGPGVPLIALIETALGLSRANDIAEAPDVARLAFGSIDFSGDLGLDEQSPLMDAARLQLILASRLGGVPAPIDTVTMDIGDGTAAGNAAQISRSNGFGGKLCIHPRQVGPVNAGFLPSEDEIAWARSVLTADVGGGAAQVGGQMIDKPVLERAERILSGIA